MRFRCLLTLLCGLILAVGCTYDSDIDTSGFGSEGDGVTTVNIRATLPEFGGVTRGVDSAQGGTTNIDWGKYRLRVIIKAYGDESEPVEYRGKEAASEVRYFDGTPDGRVDINLDMPLTSGHKYDIYMWADYVKKGSTEDLHYDTGSFPAIALKHDVPVINDETLDAFYGKAEITVGAGYYLWDEDSQFPISRAVAKLRMVATDADSASAASATLQTDKFYTGFNIATGKLTESAAAVKSEMTLFEKYSVENSTTTKSFITAYMLWPAEQSANIVAEFYDGSDQVISTIQPANAIPLKRGNLTTLRGEMLQSGWDGETYEEPMEIDDDWLVVQNAEQLAWVLKEANTKGKNKVRIAEDMDMGGNTVKPFPINVGEFDGAGHKISNLAIDGNSLFAVEKTLSIHDLDVDEIAVGGVDTEGHVGVLLDEVKLVDGENVTYSNVSISNATVTTKNGAAGGLIGYIGRATENDRASKYTVTIDNCHLTDVVASANGSEGYLVGLFSGYDSSETLIFNDNCSITITSTRVDDHESPYIDANKATWLSGVDFSKYDGWLGNEQYMRGTIKFGANTYVRKWDGVTKVEPLKDGTVKLIYSPFDLAKYAGTNPGSIKFMTDVDLGAKLFDPLTSLTKLAGEGNVIYNLKVETTFNLNSWDGGGFIRRCGNATIENITFVDADVRTTHASGSDGDAYSSIVCGTAEGNNTITNVKVIGGKLYGCNKMGGIAGYITGTFKATDCIVDGLSIENYDSGGKDNLGFKANGEVGGAFGFIAANSTISGCYVKNTTLNCIGVNNGRVLLFFKYAGRHVNEFIGDIRTTSGQSINITYTESNFSGNSYKNRKDQYSGCKYIGHCYYTSILTINDTVGTVTVNGKPITVVQNY